MEKNEAFAFGMPESYIGGAGEVYRDRSLVLECISGDEKVRLSGILIGGNRNLILQSY